MFCFNILTIFPEFFSPFLQCGVFGQAVKKNKIQVQIINIREHSDDKHQSVDDRPFGGGDGMVMSYPPLEKSLNAVKNKGLVIYLSPHGRRWDYRQARQKALKAQPLTFVCGRYAGVDARWIQKYADEEISIGDYILSGAESAVLVIMESISRFIPGVLGHEESSENETFEKNFLLKHPQWTRPRNISGFKIPEVFFSGNHPNIKKARYYLSLIYTKKLRPDLFYKKQREMDFKKAIDWFEALSREEKKACLLEDFKPD